MFENTNEALLFGRDLCHHIVLRRTNEDMVLPHSKVFRAIYPHPRTADKNDVIHTGDASRLLRGGPHRPRSVRMTNGGQVRVIILVRGGQSAHEPVESTTPSPALLSAETARLENPSGLCGASYPSQTMAVLDGS